MNASARAASSRRARTRGTSAASRNRSPACHMRAAASSTGPTIRSGSSAVILPRSGGCTLGQRRACGTSQRCSYAGGEDGPPRCTAGHPAAISSTSRSGAGSPQRKVAAASAAEPCRRHTHVCIIVPKSLPRPPTPCIATVTNHMGKKTAPMRNAAVHRCSAVTAASERDRLRLNAAPVSYGTDRPHTQAISRWLTIKSPLCTWLNSWAISPPSWRRSNLSAAPRVTINAASA